MYRFLFHEYLHSEAYLQSEQDELYLKLILFLTEQLTIERFLDCEDLLHEVMLCRIERAFLSGCEEACGLWQGTKTGTVL